MHEMRFKRNKLLAQTVIKGLKSRNMEGYYAADKAEALKIALSLIPEGSSVTNGGVASAGEIGLLAALEKGNYDYLMGADVDMNNKDVRNELINWGKWYYQTTGVDGFRLDAVNYDYIDRDKAEDKKAAAAKAYTCDVFISSANAITNDGILVNIDGNSNRVSAIAFGPEKVIFIVGMNKVASDVDGAMPIKSIWPG